GAGSTLQLYAEIFKREADVDVMHIPYRGSVEASMALMSGEVDLLVQFASGNVVSYVESGKAQAYTVASEERLPSLPDVPTSKAVGLPGFRLAAGYGLFAPAGRPDDLIQQLTADLNAALAEPDVQAKLESINMQAQPGSAEEFDAFFREEHDLWAEVIEDAGIHSNQ